MYTIYEHTKGQEPPLRDIASRAIQMSYPHEAAKTVKAWANQVLCMIAEYHLACVVKGPKMASPILPEALDNWLPPLDDYQVPNPLDQVTDVRVVDNKARTLHVGVWLHRLDLMLGGDVETAQSLLQSTHTVGPFLR